MRATAVALSSALALSALAVPAAQAVTGSTGDAAAKVSAAREAAVHKAAAAHKAASSAKRTARVADTGSGDTEISDAVVNGGKDVVLGTTNTKKMTVSFTVRDNSGVDWAQAILWHGTDFENLDTGVVPFDDAACTKTSATTANCKQTFEIDPKIHLFNGAAGTWKVTAIAVGNDEDFTDQDNIKSFKMQRNSRLTVNAAPEPVKKGKTLTISGALTRANWDTHKYAGYTKQKVTLQSRAASGKTYTSLKSYTTGSGSSAGKVKTTRTATTDTCWRYTFAGTSTTPSITSTGDCVDVR
ncbi:DUF5707 domain-containing protein [Streptomyces axinellae]|uniref:Calcium-binding protein n=1 Tax=Streptomyces axinellae TaxID=552788 RepID=A0ABN3QRG2_9ACTN